MQMRSMAVKPSIIADDLQIIATGPRRLELFEQAFDKTHEHLEDLGARIAPSIDDFLIRSIGEKLTQGPQLVQTCKN